MNRTCGTRADQQLKLNIIDKVVYTLNIIYSKQHLYYTHCQLYIVSCLYNIHIGDVLAINQTLTTLAYDTILYLHMIVLVFFSYYESRGRGIPEFFGVIFSFELLIIGLTSINCLNSIQYMFAYIDFLTKRLWGQSYRKIHMIR